MPCPACNLGELPAFPPGSVSVGFDAPPSFDAAFWEEAATRAVNILGMRVGDLYPDDDYDERAHRLFEHYTKPIDLREAIAKAMETAGDPIYAEPHPWFPEIRTDDRMPPDTIRFESHVAPPPGWDTDIDLGPRDRSHVPRVLSLKDMWPLPNGAVFPTDFIPKSLTHEEIEAKRQEAIRLYRETGKTLYEHLEGDARRD
jgi:hypothetical protein